jgi:hypothetical protein
VIPEPEAATEKVAVEPVHLDIDTGLFTDGSVLIVVGVAEVEAIHPVAVSVKVKKAVPEANAITCPVLSIDAAVGLLLVHVPPVEGVKSIVLPTHTDAGPDNVGFGFTRTFVL